MKMVDVGQKAPTERTATASAHLATTPAVLEAIRQGQVPKGDVLAAARLAGVMGVKRTPDLVPLCHPISVSAAEVAVNIGASGLVIEATVKTVDRTGVELEALTAVTAAALTIYDMVKGLDPGLRIENVQLEAKDGGKHGAWRRPT